jgi:hypothetical protein
MPLFPVHVACVLSDADLAVLPIVLNQDLWEFWAIILKSLPLPPILRWRSWTCLQVPTPSLSSHPLERHEGPPSKGRISCTIGARVFCEILAFRGPLPRTLYKFFGAASGAAPAAPEDGAHACPLALPPTPCGGVGNSQP